MPLDIDLANQFKVLSEKVAKLQDDYYTFKERCEKNPQNVEYSYALAEKKIELANANDRLKQFVKKHKEQLNHE